MSELIELTDREAQYRLDLGVKNGLGFFTQKVFQTINPGTAYNHNWHIDCIAEHLRAVEAGDIKRLIINIPPRAMKTISVSIAFPAWLLGHNPSEKIVVASYSKELSLDMSVQCRDVLRSDWYQRIFPNTVLKSDQDEKGKFMTTRGGQRFATSVGGTVTGMGGNYLILDDPLNPEQAISDIERKRANNWVRSTYLSRFDDDLTGRAILVMQRVHADDTTGMLEGIGGWYKLMLPAQFAKKEIIHIRGRTWEMQAQQLMDSNRRTKEVLAEKLRELGPLNYAAQYLQNPTPEEGAFFKVAWLKFYDELPEGCRLYIASDYAVTEESEGSDPDYTVHMVLAVSPDDDWYVVDLWRDRTDSEVWSDALIDMILEHKPLEMLEEKGVIEKAVDPLIKKKQQERKAWCYRRKIPSLTDKVARAQSFRGRMAAGRVLFPQKAPWVAELLKEVFEFPNGKHDDQVDCLSLFGRTAHTFRKGEIKSKTVSADIYKPKPIIFGDLLAREKRRFKELQENG